MFITGRFGLESLSVSLSIGEFSMCCTQMGSFSRGEFTPNKWAFWVKSSTRRVADMTINRRGPAISGFFQRRGTILESRPMRMSEWSAFEKW